MSRVVVTQQLPERWDLFGIFSLVAQVLNLTWKFIRGILVELLGEPAVERLEQAFTLVQTLVTEGPLSIDFFVQSLHLVERLGFMLLFGEVCFRCRLEEMLRGSAGWARYA